MLFFFQESLGKSVHAVTECQDILDLSIYPHETAFISDFWYMWQLLAYNLVHLAIPQKQYQKKKLEKYK